MHEPRENWPWIRTLTNSRKPSPCAVNRAVGLCLLARCSNLGLVQPRRGTKLWAAASSSLHPPGDVFSSSPRISIAFCSITFLFPFSLRSKNFKIRSCLRNSVPPPRLCRSHTFFSTVHSGLLLVFRHPRSIPPTGVPHPVIPGSAFGAVSALHPLDTSSGNTPIHSLSRSNPFPHDPAWRGQAAQPTCLPNPSFSLSSSPLHRQSMACIHEPASPHPIRSTTMQGPPLFEKLQQHRCLFIMKVGLHLSSFFPPASFDCSLMHVSETVKPGRHDGVRAMGLTYNSTLHQPQQLLTRETTGKSISAFAKIQSFPRFWGYCMPPPISLPSTHDESMTLPSSISSYRNFPNPPCTYLLTPSSVRVSLKTPLQKRRGFCIPHATDASIRPWPPRAIST